MLTRTNMLRQGRIGRFAGVVAMAVGAGGLAACTTASTHGPQTEIYDNDYRLRHPIVISEEPEVLDLPVGMNGGALPREIAGAIHAYVADYRRDGTGVITIQVPVAAANEIAATETGNAVYGILLHAGVPGLLIQVAPYHVGDLKKMASVRLSYLRPKAVVPRCGVWPEDTAARMESANYYNFGCATQQNLAATVANPADLVRPRTEAPASGARRAKVVSDYQQGAETRSAATLPEHNMRGGN